MISDKEVENNNYYIKSKPTTNALAKQNNDNLHASMQIGLNLLKKLEQNLRISTIKTKQIDTSLLNKKNQKQNLLTEFNLNNSINNNLNYNKTNLFINELNLKLNERKNEINTSENYDNFLKKY